MSYTQTKEKTKEQHQRVLKRGLRIATELAKAQDGLTNEEIAIELATHLTQEDMEEVCRVWAFSI